MLLPLLFCFFTIMRIIRIEINAISGYDKPLGPGFGPPSLVTIQGLVKAHAKRFFVNFRKDKSNIAFHLNIRFDEEREPVIVVNTQVNKTWGKEERKRTNIPFAPGDYFKIEIQCEEKYYNVTVNNEYLLQYANRAIPVNEITLLTVEGDVIVKEMIVEISAKTENKECEQPSINE
ncbi:galectin-3-like [Rhinatrema bivittatum]|uniref:galectin-3-like n=1 Tax=Rhinatrema bivittatum TaxID=194408 RepID=UPI00112D0315|nr:galectin-3-like [Rhinatrema bivittatum]